MMNMLKKGLLVFLLLVASFQGTVAAQEEAKPLSELESVYRLLLENHVSRPSAKQLVHGALQEVSEQLRDSYQKDSAFSQEDDTLPELTTRLTDWQRTYGLGWEQLNHWSISGMIASLNDPHTVFFTQAELQRFQNAVNNQFVGFGISFFTYNGNFIVKKVVPGSPASMADIKPGDLLYAVDGVRMMGKSFEEAFSYLMGEEGTVSVLSIYKPKQKLMKQIPLVRAEITMPEVTSQRFTGNVGYVRIDTFGADTGMQFQTQLQKLKSARPPLSGLIVDLRDNGGGYLSSARDVASLFMEEGLLMYTTDRNGIELQTWVRNGEPMAYPVRILVNENTASASELLAGALADHKIAKLVGKKTYGKGSSQRVVTLADGDALKITLNEYFTPAHKVVNGIGLQPDIVESDDIAQVIAALYSLGVKQVEIRENAISGDIFVNGVELFSASPVFKAGAKGYTVRANVLASLQGRPAPKENSYVQLLPATKGISIKIEKVKNEIVLTSVKK